LSKREVVGEREHIAKNKKPKEFSKPCEEPGCCVYHEYYRHHMDMKEYFSFLDSGGQERIYVFSVESRKKRSNCGRWKNLKTIFDTKAFVTAWQKCAGLARL
jgi:hypothetical protein